MNERIRELAEKTMNSDTAPHLSTELYCFTKSEFEKFAELIVRECVSICKEKEQPNLYGVREVENTIKQHFGVEE